MPQAQNVVSQSLNFIDGHATLLAAHAIFFMPRIHSGRSAPFLPPSAHDAINAQVETSVEERKLQKRRTRHCMSSNVNFRVFQTDKDMVTSDTYVKHSVFQVKTANVTIRRGYCDQDPQIPSKNQDESGHRYSHECDQNPTMP
jgi:hypothetical protein